MFYLLSLVLEIEMNWKLVLEIEMNDKFIILPDSSL